MRVKIYQVNFGRDADRVKFMDSDMLQKLQGTDTVKPSIYDEVFSAEMDTGDMEELYMQFNMEEKHPLFRGHSLSVSDVVCVDGKAYFCDSFGFKEISFDETQTQKPENLMRVVYVEPNKPPYEAEILDTLEAEQKAVGGLIEPVYMEDGCCLVGNEEAKLIGMEGNRHIPGTSSIMAGPFFICGTTTEDFRGLTDEEVEKYMELFAEPEQITKEEVAEDTGFYFVGF